MRQPKYFFLWPPTPDACTAPNPWKSVLKSNFIFCDMIYINDLKTFYNRIDNTIFMDKEEFC